ncbi:MAG: twin-arginine translocase TatA/TatE family subunit [Alphaproteobacteria bacterium]
MGIGIWQVVLILLVVVIIFGAGKLPRVMGDVAKGVRNFKSGLKDEEDDTAATPQVSKSDTAGDEKASKEKNSAAKG